MGAASSAPFDYDAQLSGDHAAQSVLVDNNAHEYDREHAADYSRCVRHPAAVAGFWQYPFASDPETKGGCKTIWECFERGVRKFPQNKYLGWRVHEAEEAGGPAGSAQAPAAAPLALDVSASASASESKQPPDVVVDAANVKVALAVPRKARGKFRGRRGAFVWKTYAEVNGDVRVLGAGLRSLGLACGEKLGIFAGSRPEWVETMLGAYSQRMVVVALYATLGDSAVEYVINHSGMSLIVTEAVNLHSLLALCRAGKVAGLRTLVQLDGAGPAARWGSAAHDRVEAADVAEFAQLGVRVVGMAALMEAGRAALEQFPVTPPQPEDVSYLMYTSGTTGVPKGALLPHRGVVGTSVNVDSVAQRPAYLTGDDRILSYLPLAHVFECCVQAAVAAGGVAVGFFSGDVAKLPEDLCMLQPTIMCGVPRVFTKMYQKLMSTVSDKNCVLRAVFHHHLAAQTSALRAGLPLNRDDAVMSSVRQKMGFSAMRLLISSAAPLPPYVHEFLRVLLGGGGLVVQGFGMTECCGAVTGSLPADRSYGHVGVPLPSGEMCLRSVSEMNYRVSDSPCPRGEMLMRGSFVFLGYFNDAQSTAEVLLPGGWVATGDVVRLNANGTISVIDRKKNIFKLSQGEYVAAERVENVYARCPLLAQIWVYGNSFKSFSLAVVVPNAETVRELAVARGWWRLAASTKAGSPDYLAEVDALFTGEHKHAMKKLVLDGMRANEDGLKGFEKVRDILIESRLNELLLGFTEQNDCLTPTLKLRRAPLLRRYGPQLRALYTTYDEPGRPGEKWPDEA